jgi:uncharacterized membrane protein YphA (DoxX/SURF4 family)
MKKIRISYWTFTGLFAAMMVMSAIPDIMLDPMAVKGMHEGLGYPLYFLPFIGVAKVLGVLAILVPGYPRIKEWAYAGLVFDLAGATFSIIASGQPMPNWIFMVMPLTLAACSYIFYQKNRNNMQVFAGNGERKTSFRSNPLARQSAALS